MFGEGALAECVEVCMVGTVYDGLRGGAMRSYDVANRGQNRGLSI
jgi:hypothetical protein